MSASPIQFVRKNNKVYVTQGDQQLELTKAQAETLAKGLELAAAKLKD